MLFLTRRRGESLGIGPDIEVAVLRIDAHQNRLGVQAPRRSISTGAKLVSAPRKNALSIRRGLALPNR
ncbi:carbon storage regulator [Pseudomonas dryadis]|uniref:Carbon storage regulator n=1 Tax=Phytopseudomonas dryadis TaxID=2487520 RepID=A0A4Q9QSY8_9GAMM|nr:hypothetical protein DNK44_25085 [Pseudomonas dryadis]